jgi:hypothetical protein
MDALNPDTWEPAPHDAVKCGNRLDLVKRERRHIWLDAGTDVRHRFTGEYKESQVFICARCGADWSLRR